MRGDFSRDTRPQARRAGTRSVLLQQGRQLLDADWNEQSGLAADRLELLAEDVIGHQGAPRDFAGFAIAAAGAGFTISAGRLYARGLLVENAAPVAYDAQLRAGLLPALTAVLQVGDDGLVYLEVLTRAVTPTVDPLLAEPALAGADTVVREQVGWTVRVTPLSTINMSVAALVQALDRNQPVIIPAWRTTGGGLGADVQTEAEATDPGPCEMPPAAGYLNQLNRLYRVEIHTPGVRGVATFKWTDDAGQEAGLTASGAGFAIDLPPARIAEAFPIGAFVEVVDPDLDRGGLPGAIGRITSVPDDPLSIDTIAAAALNPGVRVRRWASLPLATDAVGGWQALGQGVKIRFATGHYAPGSAWTIPGRTLAGDILWPPYSTPDLPPPPAETGGFYFPTDGRRRFAALALIRRTAIGVQILHDLRDRFPPLTDIAATDVRYTDAGNALGGVTNVQAAIEALIDRGEGGCTFAVKAGPGWQSVFNRVPANGHATICFAVGNYHLDSAVEIAGKGHIRLTGAGQGTKIWCYGATTALRFVDCASVTISDLLVAAQRQAAPPLAGPTRRISGSVEIDGCGPVAIRHATLIAGGRRLRQAACLRVTSPPGIPRRGGGGDLVVEDCDVVAGDLAIGILVVNGARVRITGNRIRPRAEAPARTLQRWSDDPHMAAAMGRLVLSHAVDGTAAERARPVTRADMRLFGEVSGLDFNTRLYGSGLIERSVFSRFTDALRGAGPGRFRDSRQFRLAMHNVVGVMWSQRGRPLIGGVPFDGFVPVFELIRQTIAPIVHAGVVIGGTGARDVTIADNSIAGTIDGVRIGLSNGAAQVRLPIETVRVERNYIRLRAAAVDIVRHGIHLGNVERAWVNDNDIGYETAETRAVEPHINAARARNLDGLHAEGIRVHGALGAALFVRGNVVRRCPAGVTVVAAAGSTQALRQWLVCETYVEGARFSYRLDGRCTARENVG